jgi:hypothetical protein
MRVGDTLQRAAGISAGDTAALDIELTKDWPEPSVPQDLATALEASPQQIQARCCFNLSVCTDRELSKNGRLLEPPDDRP